MDPRTGEWVIRKLVSSRVRGGAKIKGEEKKIVETKEGAMTKTEVNELG